MKLGSGPKFDPVKAAKEKTAAVNEDLSKGLTDPTRPPVAMATIKGTGKDISTAAKTTGGSIKHASDTSIGDPAAKAWHTSVIDPINKATGKVEDWWEKNKGNILGGGPGGGGIPQVTAPTMSGPAMGGVGGAPAAPTQIGPLTPEQLKAFGSNEEFRQGQATLAQQLAAQARGEGPSLAGEQFKQAQQANQAAIFAQLASARGGANPALARQAMQTSQQIQAQTARDAALARIQEQMGAREQLAGVLGTGRAGDLEQASQMQQLATQQAQLGQNQAQMAAELQAKYAQMGLSAQQANQMAAIEMAKIAAGKPSPFAVGANVLSGIIGAFA